MATVDAGYAAYLAMNARYVSTVVAGAAAAYGDKAITSTIVSPIALQADAQAEANREAGFLAGPLARDRHIVKGRRRDLIGKRVALGNARLGYAAVPTVFVIAAAEADNGATTVLTVLKRL